MPNFDLMPEEKVVQFLVDHYAELEAGSPPPEADLLFLYVSPEARGRTATGHVSTIGKTGSCKTAAQSYLHANRIGTRYGANSVAWSAMDMLCSSG